MMKTVFRIAAGLCLAFSILVFGGLEIATAQSLTYSLDNGLESTAPGGTATFVASLANTHPADSISLDSSSVTFNFTTAGLTLTDNFAATPASLAPTGTTGDTWTGSLFSVSADVTSPPGDYSGSYEIDYTDLTTGISYASTQNFEVAVTAAAVTPEPRPFAFMLAAFGTGLGVLRRRR